MAMLILELHQSYLLRISTLISVSRVKSVLGVLGMFENSDQAEIMNFRLGK